MIQRSPRGVIVIHRDVARVAPRRRSPTMARSRCVECRKRFTPAVTAPAHQRVCGEECRRSRRSQLARGRRRADLAEHREDERARQGKRRESLSGGGCHEPASDGKSRELQLKVEQIVDGALATSRATFRRQLGQILRRIGVFSASKWDETDRGHEPASGPAPRENGSGTVVRWDGVTDRDGP